MPSASGLLGLVVWERVVVLHVYLFVHRDLQRSSTFRSERRVSRAVYLPYASFLPDVELSALCRGHSSFFGNSSCLQSTCRVLRAHLQRYSTSTSSR